MGMVLVGLRDLPTKLADGSYIATDKAKTFVKAIFGDRLIGILRRLRHVSPELWRRLASLGQGATCLILYI